MPIPELVDYVRTQTQEGITAEYLRTTLMEAGWHELDIENAFHDVAAGLHPVTPGVSIHQDLAQVRGMVAHLATRIKGVEARLASIPAQAQLPTAFIGSDHELTTKSGNGLFGRIFAFLLAAGLAVLFGLYGTDLVQNNDTAPWNYIIGAIALGALMIIVALVTMRRGKVWTASLFTAMGLVLWTGVGVAAWRVYHLFEWPLATALGALFLVIAFVMGRWIQRLRRSRQRE